MPKGRTAFEILRDFVTGQKVIPVEQQYHNPLQAKIGTTARLNNTVLLDGTDLSNDLFSLTEIWAWKQLIGKKSHPFTDYVLDSEGRRLVVRVFPGLNRGKTDDKSELLLLAQHWPDQPGPHPWDDESPHVLTALMDPTGEFVQFQGTVNEARYYRDRCNTHCKVHLISDVDGDGTVTTEEVSEQDYSVWFFRRDTEDDAQQIFTQHLHIQLSGLYNPDSQSVTGGDKDILILRGESISPANLIMY